MRVKTVKHINEDEKNRIEYLFVKFEKSVASTAPGYSGTLHRFFSDNNGVWHWSGSTNQGENSLTSSQVPIDIIRLFILPGKGW